MDSISKELNKSTFSTIMKYSIVIIRLHIKFLQEEFYLTNNQSGDINEKESDKQSGS